MQENLPHLIQKNQSNQRNLKNKITIHLLVILAIEPNILTTKDSAITLDMCKIKRKNIINIKIEVISVIFIIEINFNLF